MKSISLHVLMIISVLHLASFLSTKVSNRVMCTACVYMCNLCTRISTFFVDQIGLLRHVTASISYNTGKYIFSCKKNNS